MGYEPDWVDDGGNDWFTLPAVGDDDIVDTDMQNAGPIVEEFDDAEIIEQVYLSRYVCNISAEK